MSTKVQKSVGIVGGGIAGMYAAYLLAEKGIRTTILEASDRLGGRIHTQRYDGCIMDTGAARFNTNHRLLLDLLKRLGFTAEDMFDLNRQVAYLKDSRAYDIATTDLIKDIIKKGKETPTSHLRSVTLRAFMKEHFEDSLVDDIVYSFGYNTEFDSMNAAEALALFETDFVFDISYKVIKGGLGRLTDALERAIKPTCNIILNAEVTKHSHNDKTGKCTLQYSRAGPSASSAPTMPRALQFDYVIFCVTKSALSKIAGLAENNLALIRTLASMGTGSLQRVFARFPLDSKTKKCWFDGIPRTTTNNFLRYLIPLDPSKGFIMISYTDGYYADAWNDIRDLKKHIMIHLRKLFPEIHIPEPQWVKKYYWKEGTHYWKPNAHKYVNSSQSFKTFNYLICGEVVSAHNHGWVEGALDTVDRALKCAS